MLVSSFIIMGYSIKVLNDLYLQIFENTTYKYYW